jgi:hypothetical protein
MLRLFELLGEQKNVVPQKEIRSWAARQYSAPSPHLIKQNCVLRNGVPGAIWIETGTFMGETTALLAQHSRQVYSIEPEPNLYARASALFADKKHVEIINGLSETVFPELLPKLHGDVNFWLDGHYSAGITFKGPVDTPIVAELNTIAGNLHRFGKVCVLVDDVRCFDPTLPEYSTYPSVDYLVDWARAHQLNWRIEQDIFIAKNY